MDGYSLQHSGFFVLHTPLLSFDELLEWSREVEACASDLDSTVRALVERPAIREALFLSSPALFERLDGWRGDPDSEEGRAVGQSLVRWILRMASFCPLSGAISGVCLGSIEEKTVLRLHERDACRRRVALDLYYLDELTGALVRDPASRRLLTYRKSSALYRVNGHLKLFEALREPGPRVFRSFRVARVESSEALDFVLERAAEWTSYPDLVRAVMDLDPEGELSADDAEEFLDDLIDGELLMSDLTPVLTDADALSALMTRLRQAGSRFAEPVAKVVRLLAELGGEPIGAEPSRYLEMARSLDPLPGRPELPRLFQADLIKSAEHVSIEPGVIDEIGRALSILRFCSGAVPGLESFRQAFVERFGEDCAVPLAEALDDETGVGFWPSAGPLELPGELPGALQTLLERKIDRAFAEGSTCIHLTHEEVEGTWEPRPLSGSLFCTVSLAAPDRGVPESSEPWIHLISAVGSPGLGTPARFCHSVDGLGAAFARHLRAEESMAPEVIHAEIVHWPDGRPGNAALRGPLRFWEIPLLARSGAPEEAQISLEDLRVLVQGNQILLVSERLGRRVLPRQAAEASPRLGLPLYEFLLALGGQDTATRLQWRWGSWAEGFPFVPRVVAGSVVLSRATWRMTGEEIHSFWNESNSAARLQAVQRWRLERKLPRWVVMLDGAKQLLVDFHNVLAIEGFLSMVRKYRVVQLEELFPSPDRLCAAGPEGRFLHEMVVPLLVSPGNGSAGF